MSVAALLCALCCGLLATSACAGYSKDRCSWRGRVDAGAGGGGTGGGESGKKGYPPENHRPVPSGLTQEPGSVGQLTLDCTEGAIEWLYPAGALRLTLGSPNPGTQPSIVCLRPARPFAGAQVFAERMGGNLELLLAEGPGLAGGRCIRWGPRERRALFLQATPHRDISRRVAAFRFELHEDQRAEMPPQAQGLAVDGACRPCSDTELLLAACTSDFVIHGTIYGVAHDMELQESVITVVATRVIRQTLPLFQEEGSEGQGQASIRTPLRCGVRPGPGSFLFMGWSRFGEAWLGCAPRFHEFSRVYAAALTAHLNPCEVALD
ncbi:meteorin isoform X1 [Mesocricetus auratus]|uniref:Meteorin isoform X1 n=1 Tax=Mesocricetus auratus TaxID=10036 RepID=A0ABM2XT34_MESAU|nr:meteorin isoform X1 [Mesocricetus auratus]